MNFSIITAAHAVAKEKKQLDVYFLLQLQVDPEEGEPTEEQSKFQSIGIQVEDERW